MRKIFIILIALIVYSVSYAQDCTKLQKKYDSLALVLKDRNFRLNRVRFYNNLCIKKPSQTKFLTGWIKRTVH